MYRSRVFGVALLCLTVTVLADDPPSAVGPLLKLYQSDRLPPERQPAVVEMICNRGNEHDLRVVFERLLKEDGMSPELKRKAMGWLNDAASVRKVKPAGDVSDLAKLVTSKDAAVRQAAVKLAATLQVESVAPTLLKLALDPQSSPDLQKTAIGGLAALGAKSKDTLTKLAETGPSTPVRIQAVAALVGIDEQAAAKLAANVIATAKPEDDPAPMLDALFDRKSGSDLLAAALKEKKLNVDTAKRSLRHMFSVGRSDHALSEVLSAAAGVAADQPPPTQEEVAALTAEVNAKGDAARGELIFRRADLSCSRCHSLNRAGGQVGPDLSAVGGSSPTDYIVNSILNPNLAVKEQYVTRVFQTADGRVLTGIVIDRDDTRVRFRDALGKTQILATDDIEDEIEGKSMMPQGLTKFLTKSELLDLAKFVSELGKPGPYGIRTTPILQRYQKLIEPPAELTTDVPHLEHLRQHVLATPPEAWSSVYAKFNGALPLAELRQDNSPTVVILRGEVEVTEAGKIGGKITCSEKFQAWFDADAVTGNQFEAQAEAGRHQLTFRVEISDRSAPELKVEFFLPEGSTARLEPVGGN